MPSSCVSSWLACCLRSLVVLPCWSTERSTPFKPAASLAVAHSCSCHGNQSRSVSVCHQVPGLGQLWAKATVVRAGWEEARRALGDPLSQLLFTSSWSLFSVSKHKDRSLLSDNWDQNSPVRQGPEQLTFTHIQNPFLKKKIPHYYACHLYTINSVPKIKWLLGESWCYLIGELCTCFCGLTL